MSWISHGLMISKTSIRVDEKAMKRLTVQSLRFLRLFEIS